jgi:hypothetical protein
MKSSPANLLLALATSPFIVALVVIRSLAQTSVEIGQASEEVFRGDRLPILNFPEQEEP